MDLGRAGEELRKRGMYNSGCLSYLLPPNDRLKGRQWITKVERSGWVNEWSNKSQRLVELIGKERLSVAPARTTCQPMFIKNMNLG